MGQSILQNAAIREEGACDAVYAMYRPDRARTHQ